MVTRFCEQKAAQVLEKVATSCPTLAKSDFKNDKIEAKSLGTNMMADQTLMK